MKKKTISVNAIFNIAKTVLSLMFPMITFPYISRVLQVEAVGKYNFSASIISYFSLLASLGISTYAVREGSRYREDKEKCRKFVSDVFSINVYSMVISYLVLFLCMATVGKLKGYTALLAILSLELLLTTLGVNWIYSIFEEFSIITYLTVVIQIIAIILMFTFVKSASDLYVYAFISVFACFGSSVFLFFYARRFVKFRFVWKPSKRHMIPVLMIFSTAIASTIYISSDTTIIGWLTGDYEVGVYSTAAKIYKIVKQVLNAIIMVVIPRLAYYMGVGKKAESQELCKKLLDLMILICFPAMVGLFLMSKPIVEIFAGQEYLQAVDSLRLLSVALAFAVFANIFSNGILIVQQKEKIVMFATIVSAAVNIVLNFLLIPMFQEKAAAFTTILAEVIIFLISWMNARKYVKLSCTKRNVCATGLGCMFIVAACILAKQVCSNDYLYLVVGVSVSCLGFGVIQLVMKNPVACQYLKGKCRLK